jgi:hypothetical protein
MNGNKFATDQIVKKPVEVVKGRILAGWAQKSPEPCAEGAMEGMIKLISTHSHATRSLAPHRKPPKFGTESVCPNLDQARDWNFSFLPCVPI